MKRFIIILAILVLAAPALAGDRVLMLKTGGPDWTAVWSDGSDLFLDETANGGDIPNTSTFRTNLGLDTAALEPLETFLQTANNFAEVTPTTALGNLGFSGFMIGLIGAADAATFYTGVVQDGSATDSGALKIAGAAEVIAGTNNTKAVSPLGGSGAYCDEAENLNDLANKATAFGNIKQDATTGATGVVQLADTADASDATNTEVLTSSTAYASPLGIRIVAIGQGSDTALATGNIGCAMWTFAGTWVVVDSSSTAQAEAALFTASSSGDVTLVMTKIPAGSTTPETFTIYVVDATEIDTTTAATAPAAGAATTVTTGDRVCLSCTGAGTGAYGATASLPFAKQ